MRTSLFDPIPRPPSANEPKFEASGPEWLRKTPYRRATLSSFVYNIAAVAIYLPAAGTGGYPGGAASHVLLAVLMHVMGLLSLANWTLRNELSRLADISCMLVLKCWGIAIALRLDDNDAAMLAFTGLGTLLIVFLIFGMRVADGGADKVMVVAIIILVASEVAYRPPALLRPIEGMVIFLIGYLCKLMDDLHVWKSFYWWTALFHLLTAYTIALAGMSLRGADPKPFLPEWF